MKLDGHVSIGDLSRQAGIKVVTIRYYEQIKLMPAPPRTLETRVASTIDLSHPAFADGRDDFVWPEFVAGR